MPNKKKKQLLRYEELMEEKEQEISRLRSMIAGNEDREAGIGAGNTGQTVILRERKLRTFSGRDKQNVEDWLEDIWIAVARRPTVEEKKDYILDHLTGDALEEVRHRCRLDITTIPEIYEVLREAFGGGRKTKSHLERQFYNRKQQHSENLRQYSHALMMLVERITDDKDERNTMLVEQFAENVRSSSLKRELKMICRREDITFVELRDAALVWIGEDETDSDDEYEIDAVNIAKPEPIEEIRKLLKDHLTVTDKLAHRVSELEKQKVSEPNASVTNPINQQPPEQRSGYTEQNRILCYKCGKPGHIARNCLTYPCMPQSPAPFNMWFPPPLHLPPPPLNQPSSNPVHYPAPATNFSTTAPMYGPPTQYTAPTRHNFGANTTPTTRNSIPATSHPGNYHPPQ